MIRIGILGDIGSGKSFIAKLFKQPVFDADKEVKKIADYVIEVPECIESITPVSYTHLRAPRDRTRSRMPSSA